MKEKEVQRKKEKSDKPGKRISWNGNKEDYFYSKWWHDIPPNKSLLKFGQKDPYSSKFITIVSYENNKDKLLVIFKHISQRCCKL
jgi:hypothetical protein